MTKPNNPFSAWDTAKVDSLAVCMPLVAAGLSIGVGVVAFYHADYLTGLLGVAASFASAAAVLATGEASRKRDAQHNFLADTVDHIDRNQG